MKRETKNKVIVALMVLACIISILFGRWRMAREKAVEPVVEPSHTEETDLRSVHIFSKAG